MADQATPTAEDTQKAQQVATAGATAAAQGGDAGTAMKAERDRVKLEMSDEDIEKIAAKFNELNIAAFENRGAFEAPPEPVQAPASAQPPPPPGEADRQAAAQPPGEVAPEQPKKRTFADRFFGG